MNQAGHFEQTYRGILAQLPPSVQLVAVSKTKPVEDIRALYELGQRDFGENYVQELVDKQAQLPADIRWHFIGHLQSNKVKYIAPFVHLIHGVDSLKLLKEIDKQAARVRRTIDCLLQVHIAREETKFGFDETELAGAMQQLNAFPSSSASPVSSASPASSGEFSHINIRGLMGMASFSEDKDLVRREFHTLKTLFDQYFPAVYGPAPTPGAPSPGSRTDILAPGILSMGMSADYPIAIAEGSNMVRIGSLLFGKRG